MTANPYPAAIVREAFVKAFGALNLEPNKDVCREVFNRFLADVRQDAAIQALKNAQRALAGEDLVEWARKANGSHMSYPHAMGVIDDLIEMQEDDA